MDSAAAIAVAPNGKLKMTYEEFLEWVPETIRAEWVDGEVIIHMPPKTRHQRVTLFLGGLLEFFVDFFRLGVVIVAPYEMKLWPGGPAREPDILFLATENLERLTEARLVGPADLVIELISNDSVTRDTKEKLAEYKKAGVREYWYIDTRPGRHEAKFWVLTAAGRYQAMPVGADGILHSTVVPGFWLRVEWLWLDEMPNRQQVFAEIAGFPSTLRDAIQKLREQGKPNVS